MNILIIKHIDIEGPGLIEEFLKNEKIKYKILCLEEEAEFPPVDKFTHFIILGGPMSVYEEDKYPFLRKEDIFIKESIKKEKSILGICLGAQLIAKALGAKVFKAPVKEIGWYKVSLTVDGLKDPIFSGFPAEFNVFQWHGDTFEIPDGAKWIAASSSVTNQAFRYGRNIYGLQFHLEVTEQMVDEWIKTYEEEFNETENPPFTKDQIIIDTKNNISEFKFTGIKFLRNFFN